MLYHIFVRMGPFITSQLQGYDWMYKYMLIYANDIKCHMIT